jgi:hypothetical protein
VGVAPSRCTLSSGKAWLETGSPARSASAAARSQPLTPPIFIALSIAWSEAPAARLAVEGSHALERLVHRQALVVVDHELDPVAGGGAHSSDRFEVRGQVSAAHLQLHAAEAALNRPLRFRSGGPGIHRAEAGVRANRPRLPAEQPGQRQLRPLRARVPDRHVDPGHRHAGEPLRPGEAKDPRKPGGDRVGVERQPGDHVLEVGEQLRQGPQSDRSERAHVAPAGDALVRLEIDQHHRRRAHQPGRRLHRRGELEVERPGVHGADGHRAGSYRASGRQPGSCADVLPESPTSVRAKVCGLAPRATFLTAMPISSLLYFMMDLAHAAR